MPRPTKDLACVHDVIQSSIDEGDSQKRTLERVNEAMEAQGRATVAIRTLQTHIASMGLNRMPVSHTLSPYFEEVSEAFEQGVPIQEILRRMNAYLRENTGRTVATRTLEIQLQTWGLSRREQVPITDEFIQRVQELYADGLSDQEIFREMKEKGDLPVTIYAIRKVRYSHSMKRRNRLTRVEQEARAAAGLPTKLGRTKPRPSRAKRPAGQSAARQSTAGRSTTDQFTAGRFTPGQTGQSSTVDWSNVSDEMRMELREEDEISVLPCLPVQR